MSSHDEPEPIHPVFNSKQFPTTWKKQMLDRAISDIENSEFVAIDLEFSGLFKLPLKHRIFQNYFAECVNSVNNFITVQFGVCPAWRSSNDFSYKETTGTQGDHNVWCLAPYNFYVFPSSRKIFSADTSTFSFLAGNGFSFDEWIKKGFDYARLAFLQNLALCASPLRIPETFKKVGEEGLQRIISSIVNSQKPIVVHNGLLDVLHIHDKFIDSVPVSSKEFCSEWLRIFTGGVYDTKHIATSGKYSVMQLMNDGGTVLSSLYNHLRSLHNYRSQICLAPRYYESDVSKTNSSKEPVKLLMTGDYTLNPKNDQHCSTQKSKPHEAGYDAFITAQIFLMESELYHNKNSQTVGDTRPEVSHAAAIPHQWILSPEFGQRFRDVLELAKISPGKLELNVLAKPSNTTASSSSTVEIPVEPACTKDDAQTKDLHSNKNLVNQNIHTSGRFQTSPQNKNYQSSVSQTTSYHPNDCHVTPPTKRRLISSADPKHYSKSSPQHTSSLSQENDTHTESFSVLKHHPPSSTWALPLRGYIKPSRPFFCKYSNATLYTSNVSSFKSRSSLMNPAINAGPIFPNHKIDLRKKNH